MIRLKSRAFACLATSATLLSLRLAAGGEASSAGYRMGAHVLLPGGEPAAAAELRLPQSVIGEPDPGRCATAAFVFKNGFLAVTEDQAPLMVSSGLPVGLPATHIAANRVLVSDDYADTVLTLRLSVSNGFLTVSSTVPGGLTGAQISNNGTAQVVLTGTGAQLNTTLDSLIGLLYRSEADFEGGDTLSISLTGPEGLAVQDNVGIRVEAPPPVITLLASSCFPGGGPAASASYVLLPMVIGAPDAFDAASPLGQGRFGYVPMLEDDPLLWIHEGIIRAFKETPARVDLISISDALNDGRLVALTLSATHGSVLVGTNVHGGVTAGQVTGNGTHAVTVTAKVAALNATLQYPGGLLYRGDLNYIGSDTLSAVLNAGNGITGSGSIAVEVAGAPMDGWLLSQFAAGDLTDPTKAPTVWGHKADPDGDGRDNLMEYALGLNPTNATDIGQGVSSAIMRFGGEPYLILSFNRRTDDPSLSYIPEVSGNRRFWSSGEGFADLVDRQQLFGGWERVTYRDLVPLVPDVPRFTRLKVIKNVAPAAGEDFVTVNEDGTVTVRPLFNDTDGDGDVLQVVSVTQPEHGFVTLNADGSVTYTPTTDFNGVEAFHYVLADPHGGWMTGTVTTVVSPTQDGPAAEDDAAYTYERTPVIIDVLANDACVDGLEGLRVLSYSRPAHGVLEPASDGVFRYVANAGYTGTDTFSYVAIAVGNPIYDTAVVRVDVRPWADADGDRVADDWEAANGLSGMSLSDGLEDSDGDGVPNLYEFYHKTDPRSPASVPPIGIYVDAGAWAGGTGAAAWPFQNIRDALDAAGAYTVIRVAPGVYQGARNRNLDTRGKPVLLMSAAGAATCVLDAQGAGRVFAFSSGEDGRTIVRGFQICNGAASVGAGVLCSNASPTIERCVIVSNVAAQGAGFYVASGVPLLRHCTLTQNSGGVGNGIYCASGGVPVAANTIIWGNGASATGGVGAVAGWRCVADVALAGADNTVANPGFASWSVWHLAAGSACIDAGGGADAVLPDADGEGLWDDPSRPNAVSTVDIGADEYLDSDGDSLSDAEETGRGTQAVTRHSDDDGFEDGHELALGTDPTDATSFPISIGGAVLYDQATSGVFRVRCAGGPADLTRSYAPGASVAFVFTNQPTRHWYSVDAYLDSNSNGVQDVWEPVGRHGVSAFWPTGNVTQLEIRLSDYGPADLYAGDGQAQTGMRNPYVTNATPVFSAVHRHTHEKAATGYAIQFATTPVGLTGTVAKVSMAPVPNGIRCLDIPYGGPTLAVGTRVYWRIRFYDSDGVTGPWSAAGANFVTRMADADCDGLADDWETSNGVAAGQVSGALTDADGDGFANIYEFWRGTNPTNAASKPSPTLYVDAAAAAGGDGSASKPLATIQAALNAAHEYDVIQVAAGRYTGADNRKLDCLGKPLYLTSPDGTPTVVLDCEGAGRGFFFHLGEDSRTVVRGFAIRNGASAAGGGVLVERSSPTLMNVSVEQCRTWGDGGGIQIGAGGILFCRNVVLWENRATGKGGGAYVDGDGSLDLLQGTIKGNTAAAGGGVFFAGSAGACSLARSVVWSNAPCAINTGVSVRVASSFVEGGWGTGTDVSAAAPLLTRRGYLMAGSPCIDWLAATSAVPSDVQGEARWDDPATSNRFGTADAGADEFVDTDHDGLADAWETQYFGNLACGATNDADTVGGPDGLTALLEYAYGTDPTRADTDGDGMPDGWEIAYGLDPLDPSDGATDADGDGISNAQEYADGTNCHLKDSDDDGMEDAYEKAHGFNPNDPADGVLDADGDGVSNRDEMTASSDPRRYNNLAVPVFTPAGGPYVGAQSVAISNPNPIGQIRYTTDGSEPTADSPLLAAGQTLQTVGNGITVIKARVLSLTDPPGPVLTATYWTKAYGTAPAKVYFGLNNDLTGLSYSNAANSFSGGRYLDIGLGWIVDGGFVPDLTCNEAPVYYGRVTLSVGGGNSVSFGGFSYGVAGFGDSPFVSMGVGVIEAIGRTQRHE